MFINDAIKKIMKDKHFTQQQMATATGEKVQARISQKLNGKNPTLATVMDMIDVLGYELVLQPKKKGRRPEGQILIEKYQKGE